MTAHEEYSTRLGRWLLIAVLHVVFFFASVELFAPADDRVTVPSGPAEAPPEP